MKSRSLKTRLIAVVLLMELFAAFALTAVAALFEAHTRLHAFDTMLNAKVATLFGGVGDADDPGDNVVLDMHGILIPAGGLFQVTDAKGHVLGRSREWPPSVEAQLRRSVGDGIESIRVGRRNYRFAMLHAVRYVDPTPQSSGSPHPVTVFYGAPTEPVWREVAHAVSDYTIASVLLLLATGGVIALILNRSLAPLSALAEEASQISARQWQFHAPESARALTELAPLADALEAALKRLRQSFEQQRRFTRDAAHELKTDVAIVKSSLQLLAMRPRGLEEYVRGLELSINDTLRLEQTVNQMLTFARLEERGRPALEHTSSDFARGLQRVAASFHPLAQLRQVRLEISSPVSLSVALREEDGRVLLSNLLMNALQHSPPDAMVSACLCQVKDTAVFTVEDQGEGIAPEIVEHVFEPFFRADISRNRGTGGSGLGLAICKGLCESTGGSIEIASEVGVGTRVTARVRCASPVARIAS